MTISIFRALDGELKLAQSFTRPSVYLDNCALQAFAEHEELGAELVLTIQQADGTLCLSGINMVEMSKGELPFHVGAVDRLISRLFSNLYCIDFLEAVQDKSTYPAGKRTPPSDVEMAYEFAKRYWKGRPHLGELEAYTGLFLSHWSNRDRIVPVFAQVADAVAEKVRSQQQDEVFRDKAANANLDRDGPWLHIILGELIRSVMMNVKAKFTSSDSADLIHALMGVIYCDCVILDRKWTKRVETTRERLGEQSALGKL